MPAETLERLRAFQEVVGTRAIAPRVAERDLGRRPGIAAPERGQKAGEAQPRERSARQRRAFRPRRRHGGKERLKALESVLGEASVGRDLAAENREERRGAGGRVEVECVIT